MGKIAEFFGRRQNAKGQEVPDPTPVALPLGYRQPKPLVERIHELCRVELSRIAQDQGGETFEESNDFEVGDEDRDPLTGQQFLDGEVAANDPFVEEAVRREAPAVQERLKKANEAKPKRQPPKAESGRKSKDETLLDAENEAEED